MPAILSSLSYIARILPTSLVRFLFSKWPRDQLYILRSLICSPGAAHASLTMAHDEMLTIKSLDVAVLSREARKLWIYYAELDDWVANGRADVIWALRGLEGFDAKRIYQCVDQIPHAFVLREYSRFYTPFSPRADRTSVCRPREPDWHQMCCLARRGRIHRIKQIRGRYLSPRYLSNESERLLPVS